jgi:hypothetical protein
VEIEKHVKAIMAHPTVTDSRSETFKLLARFDPTRREVPGKSETHADNRRIPNIPLIQPLHSYKEAKGSRFWTRSAEEPTSETQVNGGFITSLTLVGVNSLKSSDVGAWGSELWISGVSIV